MHFEKNGGESIKNYLYDAKSSRFLENRK